MSSMLRTRFGIPGVIATLALVFAMTGGAFAAKYLITSTKQIKPSVLKALKGKAGPAGQNGAPGAVGPVGPAGANGKDGANGAAGPQGPIGNTGPQGPIGNTGPQGPAGSPWTVGGTLPPGETETGLFSIKMPAGTGVQERTTGLSFPIPLAVPLPENGVHVVVALEWDPSMQDTPEECTTDGVEGNPEDPRADPGHLCVFLQEPVDLTPNPTDFLLFPIGGAEPGASTAGSELRAKASPGETVKGTWAVTAP